MGKLCLDLNPLVGQEYHVGDSFAASGITVSVDTFIHGGGGSVSSGKATIGPPAATGGTGPEIRIGNVLLVFHLPHPCHTITMRYSEQGGNLNVHANLNAVKLNFQNFDDINGSTLKGVTITASGTGASGHGIGDLRFEAKLPATIAQFALGGQEFWISDVCVFWDDSAEETEPIH